MHYNRRENLDSFNHGSAIVYQCSNFKINHQLKYFLLFIILILSHFYVAFAQEVELPSGIRNNLNLYAGISSVNSSAADTSTSVAILLPPIEKPKLLPDNISFGEKFFWGEKGLFREIGLVGELSPKERIHELSIRRTMLTAHQIGGFATLALMLTADYFGQQVIDGKRYLGDVHQNLVTATILSYSVTGLLAILSPPPLIRRDEGSTTSIHKTLAWIHVLGMIITPIIGSTIRHKRLFNMDQAHFHQISGYLTTAIFATSLIVITI
ncbi:MAG: hypothetical protein M1480_21430 [Bacteroidetes bacterium]|nr:hypothetical protein [Bacteroidota bacterium]